MFIPWVCSIFAVFKAYYPIKLIRRNKTESWCGGSTPKCLIEYLQMTVLFAFWTCWLCVQKIQIRGHREKIPQVLNTIENSYRKVTKTNFEENIESLLLLRVAIVILFKASVGALCTQRKLGGSLWGLSLARLSSLPRG
jgi:hypothetical protein